MTTVRSITHQLLRRHGLTMIFGNPGSNELPFLADLPADFDYVLGLHEGAVVAMADGYAQASGRPALVNLHAGAGTGNAMGALTNAVYARTPLVVVAGQQVRTVIGMEGLLANVDATVLPKPLVVHAAEPACATDVPRALVHAILEAQVRRGPSYLSVPYDDWDADADDNAEALLERRVRVASTPDEVQLDWLAGEVAGAANVALVLGGDIDSLGLFDAAVSLAERLQAPTWAAPSTFRLPFPNRHPLYRGILPAEIDALGKALVGHDLVLVIGAPVFRYHQHVPGRYLASGTRLVQVTDDPGAAARAPVGEALLADPRAVVRALLERLPADASPRTAEPTWPAPGEPLVADRPGALHPEEVFATLRCSLPTDTTYVVESTSTGRQFWAQLDLRHPGSYYFPASGGLGFGLPAAVGVQMAQPGRRVVGVIGDGAANYGITALWTAAQRSVPVTFVIMRNGTYGALHLFAQRLGLTSAPGLDIPGIDFVRIAEGYGVPGVAATTREELATALRADRAGPLLIQVDTDTGVGTRTGTGTSSPSRDREP